MTFAEFQSRVESFIANAGGGMLARYREENGKFIARFRAEEITITANTKTGKMTVKWGCRHVAMV